MGLLCPPRLPADAPQAALTTCADGLGKALCYLAASPLALALHAWACVMCARAHTHAHVQAYTCVRVHTKKQLKYTPKYTRVHAGAESRCVRKESHGSGLCGCRQVLRENTTQEAHTCCDRGAVRPGSCSARGTCSEDRGLRTGPGVRRREDGGEPSRGRLLDLLPWVCAGPGFRACPGPPAAEGVRGSVSQGTPACSLGPGDVRPLKSQSP